MFHFEPADSRNNLNAAAQVGDLCTGLISLIDRKISATAAESAIEEPGFGRELCEGNSGLEKAALERADMLPRSALVKIQEIGVLTSKVLLALRAGNSAEVDSVAVEMRTTLNHLRFELVQREQYRADDSLHISFDPEDSFLPIDETDSGLQLDRFDLFSREKARDSGISLAAPDDIGIELDFSLEDDDSGILYLGSDESDLRLDAGDSGIRLDAGDSGISLDAGDSGISLDAGDSGISLDFDDSGVLELGSDDSGISLDAEDSGIMLASPAESGLELLDDGLTGQDLASDDIAKCKIIVSQSPQAERRSWLSRLFW